VKQQTVRPVITLLLLVLLALPLCAEAGWRRTDTEHFTIIYEPADEIVASEIVSFADGLYDKLSEYLGVGPGRRVPVVIRGRTGDANGYSTYLPTRIVIFAATPSTPIVAPALDQWLRVVFTHELAHYFQVTDPVGWGNLSRVFGPSASLANLVVMPHSLAEGLAVHVESVFTDGGRGSSPVFEMQYVAALLADEFWSFDQELYGSDFAPRGRAYVGGYVMVDYIVRTWGIDGFMALSREYLRHPMLGIRRAFSGALGVEVNDFHDAMIADLDAQFGSRAAERGGEIITPDDAGYWFLVRGRTEIYGAPPTGYSRLIPPEVWADGLEKTELRTTLRLDVDPFSLSATDDVIVGIVPFSSTLQPDKWVGFTDLVVVDRGTGVARRVTRGRRLYHSALSADGSVAVAVERIGAYSRLVRIDLTGTAGDGESAGAVEIIWEPEQTYMAGPAISPDGHSVIVSASRDGEQDLYRVDLASGAEMRLTRSSGVAEYFPVFASESRLWFTANPDGPLALFELNLQTGAVTHLLTDPDGIFYATPSGEGAVYASYSYTGPSVKQVHLLSREGVEWPGGAVLLPPDSSGDTAPVADDDARDADDLPSRRYTDWPRPDLWLPLVLPGRSDGAIGLEVGGLVVGGSVLEKTMGLFTGWMNVSSRAPTVALQLLHSSGPWQATLDLASAPSYQETTGLLARLQSSASLAVGREIARWGMFRSHSVTATVSASAATRSAEGRTMAEFFVGPSEERVGASATLSYRSASETRLADLLGPAGISAAVTGLYRASLDPAGPTLGTPDPGAVATFGARLPVGPAMVEAKVTAGTRGVTPGIDTVRGATLALFGGVAPVTNPALVVRIGFDTQARLLDIGARGFSLTRVGLSGYLQQSVDYGIDGLEVRPETSAAIEVVAKAGYLSAVFLPAAGLVVTVPHQDPAGLRLSLTFRDAGSGFGVVIGERDQARLF
jgi:hypothetical protein